MTSLLTKIASAALLATSMTASMLPTENHVDDAVEGTVNLLKELMDEIKMN